MFSSSYSFFKDLVRFLQLRFRNAKIITGGNHATSTADYLIKNKLTDFVIMGEGEKSFAQLIEGIYKKKEIAPEGVISKKTASMDIYNKSKSEYLTDLDIRDFKQFYSLIDMDKYVENFKIFSLSKQDTEIRSFPIMASRGCPGCVRFALRNQYTDEKCDGEA